MTWPEDTSKMQEGFFHAAMDRAEQAEAGWKDALGMCGEEKRLRLKAEAELAALKCCGNCLHLDVELHDVGTGYMTTQKARLECDTYFPMGEWCDSAGWIDGEFSVTGFSHKCHFVESRWEARP